jgi:hypothetical protein
MYRDRVIRGRHSNSVERRYFDLLEAIRQPIVRFKTGWKERSAAVWQSIDSNPLILRTNRLIGFIDWANRGIIERSHQIHASLGLDLGTAEPSPRSAGQ